MSRLGSPRVLFALALLVAAVATASCRQRTSEPPAAGVWCWGNNTLQQLADTGDTAVVRPIRLADLTQATEIFSGDSEVCGRVDSRWRCRGNRSERWPALMIDETITQHATSSRFHCALTRAGTVLCDGANLLGQLGRGDAPDPNEPVAIDLATLPELRDSPSEAPVAPVQGLTDATAIALGEGHGCALRKTGEVVCWGAGAFGQLGNGTRGTNIASATPVPVSDLNDAVSIAAGGRHTCAIRRGGQVVCWGSWGSVADGSLDDENSHTTPQPVAGVAGALGIDVTSHLVCARTAEAVWCWGRDTAATQRADLAGARDVQLGWEHGCAVDRDGRVACWGSNFRGELGQKVDSFPIQKALRVPGLERVTALSSSGGHTCALIGE